MHTVIDPLKLAIRLADVLKLPKTKKKNLVSPNVIMVDFTSADL